MESVAAIKKVSQNHDRDIVPSTRNRRTIDEGSSAGMQMCWTCGSCDFEFPINIYTHSLRPQKIVRMANLGLLDELLQMPEIWHCINCRRCGNICPNTVKPWAVIEYARRAAIFQKYVSWESVQNIQHLWTQFQKIRWHVVDLCLQGGGISSPIGKHVTGWLERENYRSGAVIRQGVGQPYPDALKTVLARYSTTHCFTCSECSSVCPISYTRNLFDPSAIVRMVNLGMTAELLNLPAIWLCLGCRRCSNCCSQGIDSANLIQDLRELSLASGAVDAGLQARIEEAFRLAYGYLIRKIDRELGM